jgi:Flp pilus assembly protein TadD
MKPSVPSPRPSFLRRHPFLLPAALVVLGGLLAGSCWAYFTLRDPKPPTVPAEGVEKPVADLITKFRERVREQPRSAEAWGQLGKVLLANGFYPQAEQCFVQAEKLDEKQPRWPYYQALLHRQEDTRLALVDLRRAAERGERSDPGVLAIRLRLAEMLLEEGHGDEAEAQLRLVAAKDPNNPHLLYHQGLQALARDDLGTATACLSRLTQHPAARQKACAQLAVAYRRLGDDGQAAAFTRRAAELPSDNPWEDPYSEEYQQFRISAQGRLQQVHALEAEGKNREAVALLNGLDKDADSDLQLALGTNLVQLGKFSEAEAPLRKALALYPDMVPAHYLLGIAVFLQAEIASRSGPGVPEAARAKYRESAAHFRRATELQPNHGLAHLSLGRALAVLGQRDEALQELRNAVACKPEEARTHFYLAEALANAGRAEEGRHHLELALRLAGKENALPDAATVERVREKLGKPK